MAMKLGELVKDVRRRMGLTQAQLAEKLNTTQPTIGRMERDNGQVADLSRRIFLVLELRDQLDGIRHIRGVRIKQESPKVVQLSREG